MTILSGLLIKHNYILDPMMERTPYLGTTFGLGPAGYDVRVEFDERGAIPSAMLQRGDFILASTIEHFTMPANIVGIVHDKSSWARRGLAVQNTVIEPGWKGHLTLELSYHGEKMLIIPRGVGIAQVIFHRVEGAVQAYEGKYQNQERGPQKAR